MSWIALLLFLHLAGTALWIGGTAFLLLALWPCLASLGPADRQEIQAEALRRFLAHGAWIAPLTLGSGWALAWLADGRPIFWTWPVNAMQTAGIAMGGLFLLLALGPGAFLRAARESGDAAEAASQLERIRRLLAASLALGVLALAAAAQGH
ncbi:MAG TPA: hypothetical protein VFN77_07755 [Acetobacteraceae bacterium]|nr:hypothetical protein [Acetobacteraceae bacterium]